MKPILAISLETLINQALRLDPPSLHALNKLAGKILRIELSGIDLNFTIFVSATLPDKQGLIILSDYNGKVDVRICAAPVTLLSLLLQRNTTTLSNNPEVTIHGDINLAQQMMSIFKSLDIDWEEQFAQLIGDMPAHKLGSYVRQGQNYANERLNRLSFNISEYLQEEARYLPSRAEMETFLNAVDILRDDFERLEQRVQRLI